jgi:hypothetical protein
VGGITTWYVRDATGNVMSVYVQGDNTKNAGVLTQTEAHLYGSSRLGIFNYNVNCTSLVPPSLNVYVRGAKFFELSNHLGNVLATVSDKKIQHSTDGTTVDYYNADVVTANDYYPGGMQLPGRKYSIVNMNYRFGFNGQEKSTEINGSENLYTAEFWEYDSRIGRRWNLDPKPNVGISSYSGFANNPIFYSDPLGDTTVTGAGGRQSIDIDEKQNSLEYYNSNTNYTVSGTQTPVPVQAGQLRSFSNGLGKFSARWTTDANRTAAFAGYKNDKGQDLGAAVKELNEIASSWKYKLWSFGNWIKNEHDKDPVGFNLKLTTTLLTMSAMQAVEPVGYSTGYNPSVTTQESMSGLGTLKFAATNTTTTLAPYWPANGGALGEWFGATAVPGGKIDRIGGLGGKYFAPYGTPFEMRALPENGVYRAFQIMKPFPIEVSNTAPAFGRFGGGIQYRTPISAGDLLNLGYLKQLK